MGFIPDEDLEVKSLPDPHWNEGGQRVGVPNHPIQVKHIPSGITAIVCNERSQHKKRSIALAMVEYGVLEAGYRYDRIKP